MLGRTVHPTGDLIETAIRRLTGQDPSSKPADGLRLLRQGSEDGDGEASALLGALCAMGVGAPPDLAQALTLLVLAAGQGSARAQGQLRVLAGDAAPATDDWKGLAAQVDLDPWLAPARKSVLSEAPRIRLLPGFLPRAACDWLIGIGRGRVVSAGVYDAETGKPAPAETRSNSTFELVPREVDVIAVLTRAKIAAVVGVPNNALEVTQLLHYAVGQRFERHYDYLDVAQPGLAREAAEHGQRIATVLVYLNADYEGGATEFSRADVTVKGDVGDGLMFANVDREGAPDPLTLHRGAPPTSGEKWLLSQWVRDRVSAR